MKAHISLAHPEYSVFHASSYVRPSLNKSMDTAQSSPHCNDKLLVRAGYGYVMMEMVENYRLQDRTDIIRKKSILRSGDASNKTEKNTGKCVYCGSI